MKFTDVFIKRPVFAATLSLLVLLVGIMSYFKLHVRQFPDLEVSVLNVQVGYPGASAKLMEGFVTTPLENALSSIDNIDYISSQSKQGSASINVHMKLGYDIDKAMTDVASKVSSVRYQLPKEINDPVISKHDPSSEQPIMMLQISGGDENLEAITDYLIRNVQPILQTITGVAAAQIFGASEYAMRIWLDPTLMAAHGVTATDIYNTLQSHNVQAAAGSLKGNLQQFDVETNTDLQDADAFNQMVIRNDDGRIIRLRDVGKAELGPSDRDFSVYVKGKKTIFIGIFPKSNANTLDVTGGIKAQLPDIQKHLPTGVHISSFYDSSQYIADSLKEVRHTILEACFFVFLVIFLTIGSLRAVMIPLLAIPLSIVGAFMIMYALGFTVNTLTLLAFVLAIGLVVDDAIVVLENVHRHLAEGLSPFEAAISGAREIAFAIIAMTLTLAAVYAPIGFMSGLTGKLFTEFAFTLAGAVLISGFIALTLSPMLCSKLYKKDENLEAGFPGRVNRFFEKLTNGYKRLLRAVLRYRYIILILAALIYGAAYFLYSITPAELAPPEDQNVVFNLLEAPAAANLDYTEQHTDPIRKIYDTYPEMTTYGIVNGMPEGVNSAFTFLLLEPAKERKRSAQAIKQSLTPKLWVVPGIFAIPITPPSLPGAGSFIPIEMVLKTMDPYDKLNQYMQLMQQKIQQWGGVVNLNTDLKIDKPQTFVQINRDQAADLGISMQSIANALNVFLSEGYVTRFSMQGRSYEVIPQLYDRYRNTPEALNNLELRTTSNQLVPFSNIATLSEQVVPRILPHFQQLRSATIKANMAPGVTLGQALDKLKQIAQETLPKTVSIDYSGQSRQYVETAGTMEQTIFFALIFIYLILAAQFESFKDPFIVMLSVPLAFAGGLLFIHLFGGTLNIYTKIGLLTLIGLISKNGILIVEFANQQQERGMAFKEALIEGAALRLRPILMTTSAMLLGVLPLALATGAGCEARRQMGIILLGGLSFGTILTLFVVPVAYYLLATKKTENTSVIPAQAGIQDSGARIKCGMTKVDNKKEKNYGKYKREQETF